MYEFSNYAVIVREGIVVDRLRKKIETSKEEKDRIFLNRLPLEPIFRLKMNYFTISSRSVN